MSSVLKFMFLSISILILVGCANDGDVESNAAEGDPDENGNDIEISGGGDLTVSLPSDAVSVDPHGSNDIPSEHVRAVIYENLVKQNEDLEIVGQLASDWDRIDDLTWEFNLKEGVMFHDGSELTADVVKANFERVNDLAVGSPRTFLLEMIEEIEIVDDYTVRLITEYPYSPLLNNLTHGAGGLISKDLIEQDYDNALSEANLDISLEEYYEIREQGGEEFEGVANEIGNDIGTLVEQNPVGTGYMQFESRNPGESTVLVKYEDYWDTPTELDSLTYKVVSETGSRIAELETGTSDFIVDVQSNNIERIESNDSAVLDRQDAISIDYIGFNTQSEPLDNKLVRQAITHAFDKEAVLNGVYNNVGSPAVAPLAPGILGYSEDLQGLEYDVSRAEELLEEAGYADGFDLTVMVNEATAETVDVALFLQESLADLNINVHVEQVEWGTLLEATGNGDADVFIMSWVNTPGDPESGLTLFHSNNIGGSGNRTQFINEEVDNLLDEGAREPDEEIRQNIYEEAQELLVEEAPAIFIRHGEYLNAYNEGVEGIEVNSYNIFNFKDVKMNN